MTTFESPVLKTFFFSSFSFSFSFFQIISFFSLSYYGLIFVAKFVSFGQGKSFLVLPQKKEKNNFSVKVLFFIGGQCVCVVWLY